MENKLSKTEQPCTIQNVSCWHSWHEHPKEGSEVDVMWSDNTVDRLQYTLKGYNDLDFSIAPIPIKWRYACS